LHTAESASVFESVVDSDNTDAAISSKRGHAGSHGAAHGGKINALVACPQIPFFTIEAASVCSNTSHVCHLQCLGNEAHVAEDGVSGLQSRADFSLCDAIAASCIQVEAWWANVIWAGLRRAHCAAKFDMVWVPFFMC
jgi:hypothetical protein